MERKKIYFASDVHLGLSVVGSPREREKKFVRWLDKIKQDAEAIYLLGDIFDFWYEYKKVVPKGFTRTFGKIAEITDSGIPVHFFTGNHDIWLFDYLPEEIGIILHTEPLETELMGKRFFLAHGDGLGKGDAGYKRLKWIFTNKFLQCLFSAIHPRIGIGFGHAWSGHSRLSKGVSIPFKGEEELLYQFAESYSQTNEFDYFIFGHRHTPVIMDLPNNRSKLVILGEWLQGCEYAEFDGNELKLVKFND